MQTMSDLFGEGEEVIYKYTRAEAIDDGVLVDVSELAKEAGFKFPVVITQAVNALIEEIPKDYSHEDTTGRLWDLLFMASMAIRRDKNGGELLLYGFILHTQASVRRSHSGQFAADPHNPDAHILKLKLHCGPGDNMEPVITIMLPEED